MRTTKLLISFLLLFISCTAFSQAVDYENLGEIPAFSMYGDNYLVSGTSLTNDPFSQTSSDIKFQIGFKHRLMNYQLPLGTYLFLNYQQRSFWDFFQESAPFRETNYNPGLSLGRTFIRNGNLLGVLYLEVEHESNGRAGNDSRSWNRVTLSSKWCPHPKFRVDVAAWWPFDIDEETNEDLVAYTGYQKVGFSWNFSPRFFLDVDSQLAFEDETRGNLTAGLFFQHSNSEDRFIYLQFFHGYAEELFAYQVKRTRLRLGIAFRHAFFNVD
jgi:phospholipase A1